MKKPNVKKVLAALLVIDEAQKYFRAKMDEARIGGYATIGLGGMKTRVWVDLHSGNFFKRPTDKRAVSYAFRDYNEAEDAIQAAADFARVKGKLRTTS